MLGAVNELLLSLILFFFFSEHVRDRAILIIGGEMSRGEQVMEKLGEGK